MQSILGGADMAGDSPDHEYGCHRIHQRDEQAAVEGRGRPKRGWRPQSEGVREKRVVRHPDIAKEAVNHVQKVRQPLGI